MTKLLRRDKNGLAMLTAIVIVLVVIIISVAAVSVIAGSLDPYRQMNDVPPGEECVSYYRANGNYLVSVPLGQMRGKLLGMDVVQIEKPGGGDWLTAASQSMFGKKGEAYVTTSVRGPGGMEVIEFESPRTSFDFSLAEQALVTEKKGSFTSGSACFWTHGDSEWQFTLYWEDDSGAVDRLWSDKVFVTV